MKGMFPEYDVRSDNELSEAWKHGLFVFDTNVLLNLYRYQAATRDALISVLERLSTRIWIPHHVALEFQRNRLVVLAEQNARFSHVQRAVKNARVGLGAELDRLQLQKRHSSIDPEPLLSGFDTLVSDFLANLQVLREKHQGLTHADPLKARVEALFSGRVGTKPESQQHVDQIYTEAESRFRLAIPPGYRDGDKDAQATDHYVSGSILYKRKFGDYLIWRQILSHTKESECKHLIFVTDDAKDDWWNRIESDGLKTIGPRPELIEEAHAHGSVETFLMYNPEGFLKYAKEFIKTPVSEAALTEVRDVSAERAMGRSLDRERRRRSLDAEDAVLCWLKSQFAEVKENLFEFPDFVAIRDGKSYWFEAKILSRPRHLLSYLLSSPGRRGRPRVDTSSAHEFAIVLVAFRLEDVRQIRVLAARRIPHFFPGRVRVIIGLHEPDPDSVVGRFRPCDEFWLGV